VGLTAPEGKGKERTPKKGGGRAEGLRSEAWEKTILDLAEKGGVTVSIQIEQAKAAGEEGHEKEMSDIIIDEIEIEELTVDGICGVY
jgi:hypothetical protein